MLATCCTDTRWEGSDACAGQPTKGPIRDQSRPGQNRLSGQCPPAGGNGLPDRVREALAAGLLPVPIVSGPLYALTGNQLRCPGGMGGHMASKGLDIDGLLLDLENPRISRAGSQREALQKIIEDQDVKLVVLAESIVNDGLNPMDRWLVLKSADERGKYVVLEGNRRLATLRLLSNKALMKDLEIRAPVRKRLEALAENFDVKSVEPIDCFEIDDRADAATWLTQRHTGENKGSGIVNWLGVQTARFRGRDPALQALDLVTSHGSLSEEEKGIIEDWFPISTLDRVLSTPAVRAKFGVEIEDGKLKTNLPPAEVIKPLRRLVLELATEAVNVSALKTKDQMVNYVGKYGKDLPNLKKKSGAPKAVDELGDRDFKPASQKPAKPRPKAAPVRRALIPRDCYLTVSNPKIAEITKELRSLPLSEYSITQTAFAS
jgi:hypothetical protein